DLGLLRGARHHSRSDQAAQVSGKRSDRVSRARHGGTGVRLRRCVELSGPRDRRADPRRAAVAAGRVSGDDSYPHRSVEDEVRGTPHRLHFTELGRTARSRAVQLSIEPRTADAGTMTMRTTPVANELPLRTQRTRRVNPGIRPDCSSVSSVSSVVDEPDYFHRWPQPLSWLF